MAIADREKTKDHGSVSILFEYVIFGIIFFEPYNFWAKEKDFVLVIAFWS